MDKAEIPLLSASQLSELLKNRSVSPVEAVEAYLDRIDALNGRLYAYLRPFRKPGVWNRAKKTVISVLREALH